jgi:hypothetical protein
MFVPLCELLNRMLMNARCRVCDHNVTDAYSSAYERKNFSSEAFQQDREWLNLLHFIPVFLSICHSHVADFVGMSNAILCLYISV